MKKRRWGRPRDENAWKEVNAAPEVREIRREEAWTGRIGRRNGEVQTSKKRKLNFTAKGTKVLD